MPSLSNKILKANLELILDKDSPGLFSLSLVATLYLASVAFHCLIRVLDSIYKVEESRTLWKEWVVGVLLMMGLLLGLVLSLILSVFGDVISNTFFHVNTYAGIQTIWTATRWVVSSFMLMGLFLCLYFFAPNVKVAFRDAIPGAIFTTLAWQISSLLFSYYIDFVDYSYLYGKLGSAMILVGWFYWSSFVLIVGGLINAVLTRIRVNALHPF
jgi:membrane protein